MSLSAQITTAAGGIPWILLSSGDPYSEFMGKLKLLYRGVGLASRRDDPSGMTSCSTRETRLPPKRRSKGWLAPCR